MKMQIAVEYRASLWDGSATIDGCAGVCIDATTCMTYAETMAEAKVKIMASCLKQMKAESKKAVFDRFQVLHEWPVEKE